MASLIEDKELKSKKTLTELLDVQIDLNEKLKEENSEIYEQQKKFLALISKKEKKIEELRGKMLKNAKPLFICLMKISLQFKFNAFQNLNRNNISLQKGKYILKLFLKNDSKILKKAWKKLKHAFKLMKNYEKNYFMGIKNLQTILNKIDKRKSYAFLRIMKACLLSKSRSLKHKFNKIAAFKLFYFSEKVDKIIYRKKLHKYFLQIWKSHSKIKSQKINQNQILGFLLSKTFDFNAKRKKIFAFNFLKQKRNIFREKVLIFFMKLNSLLSPRNQNSLRFSFFKKIQNYSKRITEKNKVFAKFLKTIQISWKRCAFGKMKKFCSRITKMKQFFNIVEKFNYKFILNCFLQIKNTRNQIPDLFPEKSHKNSKKLQKIEKMIQKHKEMKKYRMKQKLITHENCVKDYFQIKKKELEIYFASMIKLMQDSQESLKQQNEENLAFQKNKKIQEESNLKILKENQFLEKQLAEKQEGFKKQLKETEKNQEIFKKNEERHRHDVEKLTIAIDCLAKDKGDLLSKLEESLLNLNELRNEYTTILNAMNISENEKKKLLESLKLQEKKILLLEKKNEEAENNMMNMNKKSPAIKPVKDKEKGNMKFEKVQKEKIELEEKIKQIMERNEKMKKLNMDLTKEAISLNEEKFEVKNMISNLKENLQSAKNTIVNLENKNKNLENEICDLKQDHQHLESTKMKKQDANLAKYVDENNHLKNENNKLKMEIQKLKSSLEDSWAQITSFEDLNHHLQKNLEAMNDKEQQMNLEFKSLNDSLAILNKEKVNLMREMTLIHENNLALEKELNKYKELALQSQNEIENYQNQLDVYSKVLKIMQEKVNTIENKSFEAISKTHKYNESLNDGDILSKISHLKSKLSYSSPDKGES